MSKPLSATQVITPAIEQTKRQLFKPFRFWHWARMAVVVACTGDFAGGGGGGARTGANFNWPSRRGGHDLAFFAVPDLTWARVVEYLPWILLGVGLLIGLVLAWIYIASVCRFILFDSVLQGRCELRAGWRRWQPHGASYFLWSLSLGLATLLATLIVVVGPMFAAWRAGIFQEPKEHLFLLIGGGVVLFFLFLGLILIGAVIALLAKDFAIPLMAMENVGITDAWRRLLPMLAMEKLSFAGYVGMKILLAIASGIIFGLANLMAIILLLIPMGIAGLAGYFIAQGMGLEWNLATITLVVLLAAAAFHVLLAVVCFISVPPMVFFQSYALHFFGSRYPALGERVFPPPPPLAPTPAPAA